MGREFAFLLICRMVWIAGEELSNKQEVLHLDGAVCSSELLLWIKTVVQGTAGRQGCRSWGSRAGIGSSRTAGGHALKDVEGGTSLVVQ